MLPENSFNTFLSSREAAMNALKAAQFAGGSNVLMKVASNATAYDWTGTLPADTTNPPYGLKQLRVTATAQNMDNLYGTVFAKIWVGSMSNWYRPSNMLADQKAGVTSFNFNKFESQPDVTNSKVKNWDFSINGNTTSTVFFKAYCRVSDDVVITITALN